MNVCNNIYDTNRNNNYNFFKESLHVKFTHQNVIPV